MKGMTCSISRDSIHDYPSWFVYNHCITVSACFLCLAPLLENHANPERVSIFIHVEQHIFGRTQQRRASDIGYQYPEQNLLQRATFAPLVFVKFCSFLPPAQNGVALVHWK
jgi:hypothetical protein